MVKNKFEISIHTVIFVSIITTFMMSFSEFDSLTISNYNLDQEILLTKGGGTFNPPDEDKPKPGSIAGYS